MRTASILATAAIATAAAAGGARGAPAAGPEPEPEPALASPGVVVLDAATGGALFARRADEARPIASLTKIFVALVVRRRNLDLEGWTEITSADAKAAEGGAATRLLRGESFRNLDLLHAMLLVSDNRVPTALARAVGLSPRELVDALGELARELGLTHTTFRDATGIADNRSTPRELAIAMAAALRDPVLARIMRTRHARVVSRSEAVAIEYRSTVLPLWRDRAAIRGGKTGHTEGAGYCLVIGAKLARRDVVIALLGGEAAGDRFADYTALAGWLAQ